MTISFNVRVGVRAITNDTTRVLLAGINVGTSPNPTIGGCGLYLQKDGSLSLDVNGTAASSGASLPVGAWSDRVALTMYYGATGKVEMHVGLAVPATVPYHSTDPYTGLSAVLGAASYTGSAADDVEVSFDNVTMLIQ
jgi:hypothetical protein